MNENKIKKITYFMLAVFILVSYCASSFTISFASETSVDFSDKITKVEVFRKVGDRWIPSTEFEDGDSVRVNIKYSLKSDDLNKGNTKIHYYLPEGIKISKEESGSVESGGKSVGTYRIGTDGKIEITFYDDFIESGAGIDGTLNFNGTVSKEGANVDGKITFPGINSEITIVKPQDPPEEDKYDINTKKSGVLSNDKSVINYNIIVSTNNGTSDVIDVEDRLSTTSGPTDVNYEQNRDIRVKKIFPNGGSLELYSNEYTLKWRDNQEGFQIVNLPKLLPGEKYDISYSVRVSPKDNNSDVYQLNNTAYSHSGKNNHYDYNYIRWYKKNIKKTGEYDAKQGLIRWTIEINPNGQDIINQVFKDTVYGKIHGDVYISRDGGEYINIKNSVRDYGNYSQIWYSFSNFPNEAARRSKYTISFYTIPTEQDKIEKKARNEAEFNGESDEDVVVINPRDFDLQKTFNRHEFVGDSNDLLKNSWHINIDLPEGDVSEFTYEDTILNSVDEKGNDLGYDSHYAIASELDHIFKDEIYLNNADGSYLDKKNIEITVDYFDKDGNRVLANDSTTKVKSFKINVRAKSGTSYQARYLKIGLYYTYTDLSKAGPNSEVISKNKGKVSNIEKTAETKYRKWPKLSKGVYIGNDSQGSEVYEYGSSSIKYEDSSGKIKYRLMLSTSKSDDKKDLILKDVLPENTKLDENSLQAVFYKNKWDKHDSNYIDGFSLKNNLNYELKDNNLVITIKNYRFSDEYSVVAIYYDLDISKDDYWDDMKNVEKSYLNKVTWGNEESETLTKIKRTPKKVDKTGVQLDEQGNSLIGPDGNPILGKRPSGTVKYSIIINPTGEDLDKSSDILTLKDKFNGPENLQAALDISSVKLYKYDSTKEGNKGT